MNHTIAAVAAIVGALGIALAAATPALLRLHRRITRRNR